MEKVFINFNVNVAISLIEAGMIFIITKDIIAVVKVAIANGQLIQ